MVPEIYSTPGTFKKVDLSDLIHSHNKHQIEHDVQLFTSLIAKYMANPRSIILAVVYAKK